MAALWLLRFFHSEWRSGRGRGTIKRHSHYHGDPLSSSYSPATPSAEPSINKQQLGCFSTFYSFCSGLHQRNLVWFYFCCFEKKTPAKHEWTLYIKYCPCVWKTVQCLFCFILANVRNQKTDFYWNWLTFRVNVLHVRYVYQWFLRWGTKWIQIFP